MSPGRLPAVAAIALLALACAPEAPRDVVLVTIDTLRADHLGIYGYARDTSPHIDRFFAPGAVFERSYGATTFTSASTASLLSGLPPQEHRVRQHNQHVPQATRLITDYLPPAYQTAAFVGSMIVSNDGMGMGNRFDHYDDEIGMRNDALARAERPARELADRVIAWLQTERDADRPLFLWVHFMDPHAPYRAPDPVPRRFEHDAAGEPPDLPAPSWAERAGYASRDPRFYVDRYDEEIAHVDAQFGRLLEALDRSDALDESLVILTADHGETLIERRPPYSHALEPFEEVARVPLLLRGPGVPAGRQRALVSSIDVLPTVLRFAAIDPPAGLPGLDLRAPRAIPTGREVFVESPNIGNLQTRAAIRGQEKWMLHVRRTPSGRAAVAGRRYFDLAADPGEHAPREIAAEETDAALERRVASDPDPAGRATDPLRGTLQTPTVDLLRKLGYVQ